MNNDTLSRREMLRLLALASATGAVAPQMLAAEAPGTSKTNAPLHSHPQQQLQMGREQIAILVYPEFTALDAEMDVFKYRRVVSSAVMGKDLFESFD